MTQTQDCTGMGGGGGAGSSSAGGTHSLWTEMKNAILANANINTINCFSSSTHIFTSTVLISLKQLLNDSQFLFFHFIYVSFLLSVSTFRLHSFFLTFFPSRTSHLSPSWSSFFLAFVFTSFFSFISAALTNTLSSG